MLLSDERKQIKGVAAMYYAGLDVASSGRYVYVVDRRGRKVESGEIQTNRKVLKRYFGQWKEKLITVAVEAGGHTRWIYDTLKAAGV